MDLLVDYLDFSMFIFTTFILTIDHFDAFGSTFHRFNLELFTVIYSVF